MRLLSIETSGNGWSLAIQKNEKILGAFTHPEFAKAASLLMPSIQLLLFETGLNFKDLDGVAVGRGPGSFTGTRVGLSTARGISFALKCPLFALSNFEIVYGTICAEKRRNSSFYVLLDTRGNTLCLQYFPPFPGTPAAPIYRTAEEIVAAILCGKGEKIIGDGAERLSPFWGEGPLLFEKEDVSHRAISLGNQIFARYPDPVLFEHEPFYGSMPFWFFEKNSKNDAKSLF